MIDAEHLPAPLHRARLRWGAPAALCALFLGAGCATDLTDPSLNTVVGEWCTFEGIASTNLPSPEVAFIGIVLLQDGGGLVGTGSVSRPGDDEVIPSRYQGNLVGETLTLDRTDLEVDRITPGPAFSLTLRLEGRDLVGTASGDPDFAGPIRLVRLGPRCFRD